jgi:hypothetical protein
LNEFSKISGLKVNLNKSELIPLGHSKVEIYTQFSSIRSFCFPFVGMIIPSSLNLSVVILIPGEKLWVYISRRSDDVKGFKYKNAESKLSQYADDTQIIIDGSENSIKTSINILNEFSKISGLKVNLNKSELIPLGHSLSFAKFL